MPGSRRTASCRARMPPRPAPRRSISPRAARRGGTCPRSSTPLIIHDLPVTVWWPGEPPFKSRAGPRPAGRCRPPRRRRLVVGRRRPRTAARDGRPGRGDGPGGQRLRAHPSVALARGDRLDLRRPGLPALPALAPADRRHVRDPRRDRCAGLHEHRQAAVPRGLARLAPRAERRQAAGAPSACRPVRPRDPVRAPGARPVARSRDVRDAGRRARRGGGRRPARPLDDAGRDDPARGTARGTTRLGAARGRHRGGRERSTSASGSTAWRRSSGDSSRPGAGRSTCSPRRSRAVASGTSWRSVRCTRPRISSVARSGTRNRPAPGEAHERTRDRRRRRRRGRQRGGRRPHRRVPARRRRAAGPRRLGDDRRLGGGRHLPASWRGPPSATSSRGTTSIRGGATTASFRATTRCPTSSRSTTSSSTSATTPAGTVPIAEAGVHIAGREPPSVPDGRGDRRRPGSGRLRGAAGGRAPRARACPRRTAGRSSIS